MATRQTDSLARIIGERYEELMKAPERGTLQTLWDELSRYVMPHEQSFSEKNPRTGTCWTARRCARWNCSRPPSTR